MLRASLVSYLSMPTRSAWPGRGVVIGRLGEPGSGDISSCHRGHSVLRMITATGEPSVRPCRTPPMISSSSRSIFMRLPRPYPKRRRANSAPRPSRVKSNPAGTPSTMVTSPGPCDSPAVKKRSMPDMVDRPEPAPVATPPTPSLHRPVSEDRTARRQQRRTPVSNDGRLVRR